MNVWNYPSRVILIVRLRGFLSLRIGSIHHVEKMSHQDILAEHVVDIHKVVADFRDAFERNQSSSSQLPNHLCRKGSASTTGTLGRDVERKMLSRNKLQKHLTMLITMFFLRTISRDPQCGLRDSPQQGYFHPDMSVKSIFFNDTRRALQDQVVEGEQGLMKLFLIVPCFRHRSAHCCGDPDPFRTTRQTSVDFSSHLALSASGK